MPAGLSLHGGDIAAFGGVLRVMRAQAVLLCGSGRDGNVSQHQHNRQDATEKPLTNTVFHVVVLRTSRNTKFSNFILSQIHNLSIINERVFDFFPMPLSQDWRGASPLYNHKILFLK